MTEPIITEQAQADLDEMWDQISERDLRATDRLLDRFYTAARTHAQFPESGRSQDDLAPGLRSFVVKPYVVFYRPAQATIEVLRVLHGRRDLDRIMRGEGGSPEDPAPTP